MGQLLMGEGLLILLTLLIIIIPIENEMNNKVNTILQQYIRYTSEGHLTIRVRTI